MANIRINPEHCRGCRLCLKACPFGAIAMEGRQAHILENCTLCGACVESCKFKAIEFEKDEVQGMDTAAYAGIWVFAEQCENILRPVGLELLGQARRLADVLGVPVTALLLGANVAANAQTLIAHGADTVLLLEDDLLAEQDDQAYAALICQLVEERRPEIILLGATSFGRSLAPRIAARLQTGLTADCTVLEVNPQTRLLEQTRPAFGGNLMATIICPNHRPQMATVRPKVFKVPQPDFSRRGKVLRPAFTLPEPLWLRHLAHIHAEDEGPSILDAEIIVSVGRGMSSDRNLALARELAQLLGGALACSRPLVDTGVLPPRHQVGQTGRTVSPKLYIALGISGAIQHLAGIGGVESVVAVNKDPEAPIFSIAHYCIVGDCAEFAEALVAELKRRKSGDCYE